MDSNTRESRLSSFKNCNKGVNELRRKRAELSVTLRKQVRDEQRMKRRMLSPDSEEREAKDPEALLTPEQICMGLKSDDVLQRLSSAKAARRILSKEQNPPINMMIEAGIVKPLVEALERYDCVDLQFEAAWALTNIASGTNDQTMAVVNGGALPKLIRLVELGGTVGEQCAWVLGNIAGDGAHLRDLVLGQGALHALLPCLTTGAPASTLRTAVWTYSNLCRNKNPLVDFDQVAPALPLISELLEMSDNDILADACWAISYLTDGPNDRIERVQHTPKLLSRVVKLLDNSSPSVKTPALRAVGNMVTGSDEQTDRCLDVGCLDYLAKLLQCGKPSLVKEAAWAVSNVLAGTQEQIQRAIDFGMIEYLVHVIATGEPRCQKEAAWAITNLCLGGSGPQLATLLQKDALPPFCALLDSPDHRTIIVVLDGLLNLLQTAEKFGETEQLCLKIEEIGALDRLEALQQHENEQLYTKLVYILETFFMDSEEKEPATQGDGDEFQFGATNQNIQF